MGSQLNEYVDSARNYLDNLGPIGKAAIAGGAGLVIYVHYKWLTSRPRRTPYVQPFAKDVVYLCQYPRSSVIPNLSPYCLKLETWLRIADIPYRNVDDFPATYRSHEGTLPFAELNGIEYPDSTLATRDLATLLKKENVEAHLTDEQRSGSVALEALIEHVIWPSYLKFRQQHIDEFLALAPWGQNPFVKLFQFVSRYFILSQTETQLFHNGIGKHSDADIIRISEEALLALSKHLSTRHYLNGFKATRLDATAFGVLAQIVFVPFETPQQKFIKTKCPNLKEYCDRMRSRYWPDWSDATERFSTSSNWKRKASSIAGGLSPRLSPNGNGKAKSIAGDRISTPYTPLVINDNANSLTIGE